MLKPRLTPDNRALLNVGCGERFHHDWTNIDLVSHHPAVLAYDIARGLPFADNQFDVVYHSHIIEHLTRPQARRLLEECHRILKPHGILRVVAPDLQLSTTLYLQALADVQQQPSSPIAQEHYEWAMLNLLDQMVRTRSGGEMAVFLKQAQLLDLNYIIHHGGGGETRMLRNEPASTSPMPTAAASLMKRVRAWVRYQWRKYAQSPVQQIANFRAQGEIHQWMYDAYNLSQLLTQLKFSDVQILDAHTSTIQSWATYGLDLDADGKIHKTGSLFIEATK